MDILSVAANFPPDKMSSVHWIARTTDILSVVLNFPTDKMSIVHWITCATDILSVAANFPPDKMSSVHWITRMTDILSVAANFPTDKLPALQLPGRAKLADVASLLRNSFKVKPMSQDNSGLVLRWFDEVWNQRRAETIDELMTAQSVCLH